MSKKKDTETKVRELQQLAPTVFDLTEKYLSEKYELRKNIVLDTLEIKEKEDGDYSTLEDESNLYIELQKNRISISLDKLKALLRSDFVPKYDPITEYFNSLPEWDKKTNHIENTANYIQVHKSQRDRFIRQFRKMLVRTIACAINEKVFNKQIFVLIGRKQNTGKTTFLRWLCPTDLQNFYTENITFEDKDSNISITENFIINIDELATLHRTEINKLKSFISKEDDKSRRAYAARAVRRIRRASFVASTNDTEFLTDTTGNVRWLCFEIEGINFDYMTKININDVWSQAYALYQAGFDYQLTNQEVIENETINSNYMKLPAEAEIINRYFIPGTKENYDYFLNASDFLTMLAALFNVKNANNVSIGKSLAYLGFLRQTHYRENLFKSYSVYGYYVKLDRGESFFETIDLHLKSRLDKKS